MRPSFTDSSPSTGSASLGMPVRRYRAVARPLAQHVGRRELFGVVVRRCSRVRDGLERAQGRRFAHRHVRASVLELQQLNGELDVGQRAPAELQMELRVLARQVSARVRSAPSCAGSRAATLRERIAIDETVREVDERGPELGVARDERALVSAWNSHVCPHRS